MNDTDGVFLWQDDMPELEGDTSGEPEAKEDAKIEEISK